MELKLKKSIEVTQLCLDLQMHKFVFLRQISQEKTWHNWVTEDVFYCEKCLVEARREIEKPERRW